MLNLVHQKILDQELSQNVLEIPIIRVEGEIFIQNQNLFMDQFINHNSIILHI